MIHCCCCVPLGVSATFARAPRTGLVPCVQPPASVVDTAGFQRTRVLACLLSHVLPSGESAECRPHCAEPILLYHLIHCSSKCTSLSYICTNSSNKLQKTNTAAFFAAATNPTRDRSAWLTTIRPPHGTLDTSTSNKPFNQSLCSPDPPPQIRGRKSILEQQRQQQHSCLRIERGGLSTVTPPPSLSVLPSSCCAMARSPHP